MHRWDIVGRRNEGAPPFTRRRCLFGGIELPLTQKWEGLDFEIEEDAVVSVEGLKFLCGEKPVEKTIKTTTYGACVVESPERFDVGFDGYGARLGVHVVK